MPLKYSLSFAKLSILLQENAMVEHAPCPSADPDSYISHRVSSRSCPKPSYQAHFVPWDVRKPVLFGLLVSIFRGQFHFGPISSSVKKFHVETYSL